MRLEPGQVFQASGTPPDHPPLEFRVVEILGPGGQGWGHLVEETTRGWTAFAKTFHEEYINDRTAERTLWLAKQGIDDPGLLAPRYAILDGPRVIGHVSPAMRGTSVYEAIFPVDGVSGPGPAERLGIARRIVRTILPLHARRIAHGDVSGVNFLMGPEGNPYLIDYDNYRASGVPPPFMQGTPRYTAPWVLRGALPDERSDVWSAAIVVHETLLGRHPILPPEIAADGPGPRIQETMMRAGRWLDDPSLTKEGHLSRGGAPVRWLSPGLIHFFRDTFAQRRPTSMVALSETLMRSAPRPCMDCGMTSLHDASGGNPHCPWCRGRLAAAVRLSWGANCRFLPEGTCVIGRRDIDHPEVSREHLRLVVCNGEVSAQNLSRNGTRIKGRPLPDSLTPLQLPVDLRLGPVWIQLAVAG
jgi:serine/threonine protein kinase